MYCMCVCVVAIHSLFESKTCHILCVMFISSFYKVFFLWAFELVGVLVLFEW